MLASSFFIAKQLYPKKYKALNPEKKANEIFSKFVGQNLYDVLKKDLIGFKKILIKNNKLVLQSINNNG